MAIFFYLFSGLLITGSMGVVLSRNPVHSVLWLIFAFCNASGIFILLGAEFLAMTLVIVYVGAVAVLFLFVVMMLDIKIAEIKEGLASNWPLMLFFLSLFALDLVLVILFGLKSDIVPKSEIVTNLTNTEIIGTKLYTEYMLPFQIAGLVLLVAMIGCIALTFSPSKNLKRQNISEQVARNKGNSLEIKKVKLKTGVKDIKYE
ncbi:MAG UNVERIFIED_CONTAM: NADH-quinone oxidoreductase subunit J [Planctomycetaceae bacterium]|jgi:NADH-quinone oxidoreductase subunit J